MAYRLCARGACSVLTKTNWTLLQSQVWPSDNSSQGARRNISVYLPFKDHFAETSLSSAVKHLKFCFQFARHSSWTRQLLLSQSVRNPWFLGRILSFNPPKGNALRLVLFFSCTFIPVDDEISFLVSWIGCGVHIGCVTHVIIDVVFTLIKVK